jgi:lysophospholipase L1-like esterase
VRLLISLENPSPEVIEAVEGAVAWFRKSQIDGIREVEQADDRSPTGKNKVIVADPKEPPLWARFYEIETNRPIFADRDGVAKYSLGEIGYERRNNYSWYGASARSLLEKDYPAWKRRWVADARSGAVKKVRIALAGDSTVADSSGWGPAFAKRLGSSAECLNLARSGRSSKSYRDEGHWKKVLEQRPDYVLIQFGHNDQPGKGPERETDPETTYRQNLERYIDEAQKIGAKPVLVTSMTRRNFVGDGKIRLDGLDSYVKAARRLAAERGVPLVDLYARSVALLEKIGPEAAAEFNPPSQDPSKPDRTHLSPRGGDVMAGLVVEELRHAVPELADQLR